MSRLRPSRYDLAKDALNFFRACWEEGEDCSMHDGGVERYDMIHRYTAAFSRP